MMTRTFGHTTCEDHPVRDADFFHHVGGETGTMDAQIPVCDAPDLAVKICQGFIDLRFGPDNFVGADTLKVPNTLPPFLL
ncbi:MAG: hypothetical protein JSV84_02685 [Gemmatimonadota bacterium]|nr:MAG: hypothetical protein JSV84_02685 [Gemmatimonadota bacterium]